MDTFRRSTTSALLIRSTDAIGDLFRRLSPDERKAIRCLVDVHVSFDIATLFDRPVRFFTIVRHPVDRVISSFYYIRTKSHVVSYPFIKDLSFEEYLDSRIGLDSDNHQVRVLSGCPELDAPWDPQGRAISTPPVERRHLEMAKRNIEERFIVAAALEQFAALVWFFKRLLWLAPTPRPIPPAEGGHGPARPRTGVRRHASAASRDEPLRYGTL